MCEAYDMMQMVSQVGKKWKENMMLYTFLTIIMLHYELCPDNNKEKKQVSSLSMRFQEAVVKHYRESSDVDFYARMFGLSPKYFSYLIKSEIGIAPKRWINNYIAMQAKTMLIKRSDLNIQQVAYLLGFKEQTSFTRFFKSYVGVSPREYRDNPGALK
jgi:AraC-like DNA-binding protein